MRSSVVFFFHNQNNHHHLQRTTLVLRNLPHRWTARAKSDVDEFVRRVFLAQPALVRTSSSITGSATTRKPERAVNKNFEDLEEQQRHQTSTSGSTVPTIPAGHIPPHIREKWGLDQLAVSQKQQEDFSQGLSKYFSKRSSGGVSSASTLDQQNSQRQNYGSNRFGNSNNNNSDTIGSDIAVDVPLIQQYVQNQASFLTKIKFTGEHRRSLSVILQFASPRLAAAFSSLLPRYLDEVRRSRGLSVPASLVGAVEDERSLGKHYLQSIKGDKKRKGGLSTKKSRDNLTRDLQADDEDDEGAFSASSEGDQEGGLEASYDGTVTAATLDFAAATSGLYCTIPVKAELPELLKAPTRRQDGEMMQHHQQAAPPSPPSSTSSLLVQAAEVIKKDRHRRKELALAVFRSVGRVAEQQRANEGSDSSWLPPPNQEGNSSTFSSFSSAATTTNDVRLSEHDMSFRQHDIGNLVEARSDELNSLMENNPLLNFESLSRGGDGGDDEPAPPPPQQHDAETSTTSLFIAPSDSAQESVTPALESAIKATKTKRKMLIAPRLLGPSLAALTFYEQSKSPSAAEQGREREPSSDHWKNAALEEELAVCNRITLDRYMMSPDLLWNVRKKYTPRRVYKSGDSGVSDNEDDEDVVEGGPIIFASGGAAAKQQRISKKDVDRLKSDHEDRWRFINKSGQRHHRDEDNKNKIKNKKGDDDWWTSDVFG